MKSLLGVGAAGIILVGAACSSSSSGTFIPNEGGTEGGKTSSSVGPDGKVITGGACAGATTEAATACTGLVCISLVDNAQGKAGICSESCANGTCSKLGTCVQVPDKGPYCFKTCSTNDDCVDGFVCQGDATTKICIVTAATTTADGG